MDKICSARWKLFIGNPLNVMFKNYDQNQACKKSRMVSFCTTLLHGCFCYMTKSLHTKYQVSLDLVSDKRGGESKNLATKTC